MKRKVIAVALLLCVLAVTVTGTTIAYFTDTKTQTNVFTTGDVKILFTENGEPFVTAIQNPCESFEKVRDITDTCVDCKYFKPGEELIGLCSCKKNLRRK